VTITHFKHSHRWKRQSCSNFASHYTWGTNGVCECKMDVKSTWILTWHHMDHVSWSLGLSSKTTSLEVGITQTGRSLHKPGDHGTPNVHNHWFILFYHVWGPVWIEIHWNSIWLRAWLHVTSHYTWGSVITLHDFGGVLGRPLNTFFWALVISWSRLLARVWPYYTMEKCHVAYKTWHNIWYIFIIDCSSKSINITIYCHTFSSIETWYHP
jgi:hypothetical protein